MYCGTKHFVDAFTTASRHDLVGSNIRVTSISPGVQGRVQHTHQVPLTLNQPLRQDACTSRVPQPTSVAGGGGARVLRGGG